MPSKPRFFFGWAIVAFTFAANFLSAGALFYSFSALLKPLAEALNADRFPISIALSLQLAIGALAGPWVGRRVAERSIRALMMAGAALALLGFLAMSQTRSIWHLYLSFSLVLGVAGALLGAVPNNTLLANWFDRRRGLALGISGFGLSLSGTVFVPLTSWLVLEYGWRAAVSSFGLVICMVLVPLAWRFAIKQPQDLGMQPDHAAPVPPAPSAQEEPASARPAAATAGSLSDASRWRMARALRDRRVWHLVGIVGPSYMGIGAVMQTLHSHITDLGLSAMQASSVLAVATLAAAVAKPLFGLLADCINKRLALAISLACQIAGLTLVLFAGSQASLMVAGLVFGLGYGAVNPLWSVLLIAVFGRQAFPRAMGTTNPLIMPFIIAGFPFSAYVFDISGSYASAFLTLLAGFGLALALLALLRLPEERSGSRMRPSPEAQSRL